MRYIFPLAVIVLATLGFAACDGGTDPPDQASTGGVGGSGGQASASAASSSGSGGSAPSCMAPVQGCDNQSYCNAPEGSCPANGVAGACAPRPTDCAGEPMAPVCGCYGQVYINACEAQRAGDDVGSQAGCVPPMNPFACGAILCEDGEQFCESINGYYQCKQLPDPCKLQASTCDCLKDVRCHSAPSDDQTKCDKNASAQFFVSCTVTE